MAGVHLSLSGEVEEEEDLEEYEEVEESTEHLSSAPGSRGIRPPGWNSAMTSSLKEVSLALNGGGDL